VVANWFSNWPFWDPYGLFFQLGWFIVLFPTLILVGLWYFYDWICPPTSRRRQFLDRIIPIG
jgi:hypothetical protein